MTFQPNALDKVLMTGGSREECAEILRVRLRQEIEPLPRIEDSQVGIGIESLHEFFPLVEHVGFHGTIHFVPTEGRCLAHHLAACPLAKRLRRDKCLVRDSACQREPRVWPGAIVVIAAIKIRIGFDAGDLLEIEDALEHRGFDAGADGNYGADAARVTRGQAETKEAANGSSDHGVEGFDPEMIEKPNLRIDDVADSQYGEVRSPDFTSGGIDGRGACGAVAAAEIIGANDKQFPRVERPARTDEFLPPSLMEFFRPSSIKPGHIRIQTGCVLAAGHRVKQEDRVGSLGVQPAIGLVGKCETRKRNSTAQPERFSGVLELKKTGPDSSYGAGHAALLGLLRLAPQIMRRRL